MSQLFAIILLPLVSVSKFILEIEEEDGKTFRIASNG